MTPDTTIQSSHVSAVAGKSIYDQIEIVLRRKAVFLSIFVPVVMLTLGIVLALPPVYQSKATITLQQQEIPEDLVKSTITSYADQRIQEIGKRLMTNDSLSRIIKANDLYADYREAFPLEALVFKMRKSIHLAMSAASVKGRGLRKQPIIDFTLAFDYPKDPVAAQKVVEELANLFLKENERDRKNTVQGTYAFLHGELQRLEKEAERINLRLASFKNMNAGALPSQADANFRVADRLERDIAEIDRQLFDLKQQNVILESNLRTISKYMPAANLTNELGEKVMSSEARARVLKSTYVSLLSKYSPLHPKMKKIKKEIAALSGDVEFGGKVDSAYQELSDSESELKALRSNYGKGHPKVVEMEKRVTRLKSRIGDLAESEQSVGSSFEKELNPAYVSATTQLKVNAVEMESLRRKKEKLLRRQEEIERGLLKSPVVETEYNKLEREYNAVLDKISDIRAKLNRAEISEKLESSNKAERFKISEAPTLPFAPVKPNRIQLFAIGVLLASALGFLGAMIRDRADRSIYNNLVMARETGENPLTVVPFMFSDQDRAAARKAMLAKLFVALVSVGFLFGMLVVSINMGWLGGLWETFTDRLQLMVL